MDLTGEGQQITITSLPFDILCKIVMEMNNQGIFALRRVRCSPKLCRPTNNNLVKKVCKILNAATKIRQVWYKFICDLTRDYKVSPPEEAIENYTIGELERWVVLRRWIKHAWHGRKLHFRRRIVAADVRRIGEEINSYQLLPGGKWLVVPHMQRMYFYNLDAPALEPKLLFDPKTELTEVIKYCKYWIDGSKSGLTFYLAGRVSSPHTGEH